jgi:hypothetical protein
MVQNQSEATNFSSKNGNERTGSKAPAVCREKSSLRAQLLRRGVVSIAHQITASAFSVIEGQNMPLSLLSMVESHYLVFHLECERGMHSTMRTENGLHICEGGVHLPRALEWGGARGRRTTSALESINGSTSSNVVVL